MAHPLSDEEIRERLREEDAADCDLDEIVLLARSTGGTRHVYHDREDPCVDFSAYEYRAGPERVTRREARDRGLAPCAQCLVRPDQPQTHNYEPQQVARHFDASIHDSLADARADLNGEVSD